MSALQALLGIAAVGAIAFLLSKRRGAIRWRRVALGVGVQLAIALVFLHLTWAKQTLVVVTQLAEVLKRSTQEATSFVFGYVGGADLPFELSNGASTFIFAFQILPVIMVIGALSALLWHWRVLGLVVAAGAWVVRKVLGVSAPVGFAAVANAFLGMIEAPLLIKPYLSKLSSTELFTVMAVGMSTIAGGTAIIISGILSGDPEAFGRVVTATLMNVPGAIALCFILFPAVAGESDYRGDVAIATPYRSSMDALVTGTADGVKIFVNVVSLLIVFIALVAMVNAFLGLLPGELTLDRVLGWVFAPIAWLIGVPADEVVAAGGILGTKVAVNELVAYAALAENSASLSPNTYFILTFALCGFGNFGSLAILIGGMSAMAPERRDEIVASGLWALLVALLTNCLTAAIAFLAQGAY